MNWMPCWESAARSCPTVPADAVRDDAIPAGAGDSSDVQSRLPPGIEIVRPAATATPGGPSELRVVVDFRGLPPELTGATQDAPIDGPDDQRSGADRPLDPQSAAASGPPASSNDASATSSAGGDGSLAELRARIEVVLGQLLAAARKQQADASQGALPIALPVMLRHEDGLVAKAIFNSRDPIAKTAGDIVDSKINELKFFIYSEERRFDYD